MTNAKSRTWAEISISALTANYKILAERLRRGNILCVVKADAYGHGAARCAIELQKAGASFFGVATPEEAFTLRDAGISARILVLGASPPEYVPELINQDIAQDVPDLYYAREYSKAAIAVNGKLTVHAKIETGMGRLGFGSEDDLIQAVTLPGLDFEGVFTHFRSADDPSGESATRGQYDSFISAVERIENTSNLRFPLRHSSNSGAFLRYPEYALDLSRVGLLLYGCSPDPVLNNNLRLKPVMTLKTRIAQVRQMKAGDKISYGGIYTAEKNGIAATLPIGYADGLFRSLSGRLEVLINAVRVPQIGRICMDLCVADITGLPNTAAGTEVTVFGQHPAMTAQDCAEIAGTIPYEILCGVSARVPRVYVDL